MGSPAAFSITCAWDAIKGADCYAAQFAEHTVGGDPSWTTMSSSLKNAAVKKKNLKASTKYLFRVRGRKDNDTWASAWSEAAEISTIGVNPSFANMLGKELTNAAGETIGIDALAGGLVALYFSASWCPPCRKFTPRLAEFYKQMKQAGQPIEVVFVSADREKGSFQEYLSGHHPWLAIPFDSPTRQNTSQFFKVSGIPALIIFAPTGQIVEASAVQAPLTQASMDSWKVKAGLMQPPPSAPKKCCNNC